MMQKDYPMELACKNSKDFMDMCAVYFMHQIGSKHDDIKVVCGIILSAFLLEDNELLVPNK
jgi:hypothetical protein